MRMKMINFKRDAKIALVFLSVLISLIFFVSVIAKASSPHITQSKQEPTDNSATIEQIENQAFVFVNEYRKSLGLPILMRNNAADQQARIHSKDMAAHKVAFGHDGATKRLKTIGKTLNNMEGGGENVFECSEGFPNLAKEAFNGWLHSEGHRKNMIGDYNLAGMGVAKAPNGDYYFTQIFIKGN
jgi:uncharacterized protein YkwD